MGKTKKTRNRSDGVQLAKIGLAEDIANTLSVKPSNRQKTRERPDVDEKFVDSSLSRKILSLSRQQQAEIEEECGISPKPKLVAKTVKLGDNMSDDDDNDELSGSETTGNEYYEDIEIDEEDEKALEMFMNKNKKPMRLLSDIIMEKLAEKRTEIETQCSDVDSLKGLNMDPRVEALFKNTGEVLSKYRSGKLPKCLKMVPIVRNWQEILYIMQPHKWTAAAMCQATRIFASNLKSEMAKKFYSLVLLPRIRDDIAEYKRLNFHLYQALRKALYKPAAFMKGLVLPLLMAGDCTLREAIIICSVIERHSIPEQHSSAAMLKIAEMEYTGANSIFLRTFLDKKYALPYMVVDGVFMHFLRFERDPRELPVLWHQALLTFVQRYKNNISSEQKEELLRLLKKQQHPKITPEIRRELQHSLCRDEKMEKPIAEPMDQ